MSVALMFPGQGAQRPGMLSSVPDTAAARAVVAEGRRVCDELHVTGDLDDPGHDTVLTQLSLVITGVACARALLDDIGLTAAFAAGHSVGAFPAAVAAGAISLRDALIAVHLRAESMRAACAGRGWGMAAVTGAPIRTVRDFVDRLATPTEPVWIANVNSATQTVVGGTVAALAATEEAAQVAGARSFERLDIEIASHGTVQEPTARALAAHLSAVEVRPPVLRYLANATGRVVLSAEAVRTDLAASVAQTVRWYDGVRVMGELGLTSAVEAVPGHTLTRLVAASVPMVTALSLDDDGLRAVTARTRHS